MQSSPVTEAAPLASATAPATSFGREIEFWFDLASNYSYLSAMRIEKLAATRDVRVIWRPFLLGPIFLANGWNTSPFVLQKAKGEYVWRDMARQCFKYQIPWTRPSRFPQLSVLPARVAIFGARKGWIGEYCRLAMLMNFAHDHDIHDEEANKPILSALGLPAVEILAAAQTDENKLALRRQTECAIELGIFGAPTFFVRGEMFWGNDRLDEALELAATSEDSSP